MTTIQASFANQWRGHHLRRPVVLASSFGYCDGSRDDDSAPVADVCVAPRRPGFGSGSSFGSGRFAGSPPPRLRPLKPIGSSLGNHKPTGSGLQF